MGAADVELRMRPLPDERALRPSRLSLLVLVAALAALVVAVRLMDEHFGLGIGVAALIAATVFGLMNRAARTGARAGALLHEGRVDEARDLFVTAATRSRAFARLHVAHRLHHAVLELESNRNERALSLLSSCWQSWGHDAYTLAWAERETAER